MIVANLRKADTTGSIAPQTRIGVSGVLRFDDGDGGGYVVATRDVIGVVDGETGEMFGRHLRRDAMALHRTALAGHRLWLPPAPGGRLGRAAPTVLDLAIPTTDRPTREALAAALGRERAGKPAWSCDSMDTIRYDGIETSAGQAAIAPSREPPWDAAHLAQAARRFACASSSAIVTPLAWAVIEDSRPLRNHYALMMVEQVVDGEPLHTVVSMYRHATNVDWNISVSFHDPSSPLRRWVSRPSSAEIDAFVDQADFPLLDTWGTMLAGNVLDSNWVLATGEPPLRHLPAGVEQLD
jgi:hypothetical protein